MSVPRNGHDEFYVGYASVPPGLARFRRMRTGVVLALALTASLALAWAQRPPADASYAFGEFQDVSGLLLARPYPMLLSAEGGGVQTRLLVAQLKRGADSLVQGLDGRMVQVSGARIERAGQGMLELRGAPAAADAGGVTVPETVLGDVTLTGEVVDGKCWLGAMNPGQGATHRLCAVRCLLGGLPPLFVGVNAGGDSVTAVLVGPASARIDSLVLRFVAARARVTGRLRSIGTLLVLEADPSSFRRVNP